MKIPNFDCFPVQKSFLSKKKDQL